MANKVQSTRKTRSYAGTIIAIVFIAIALTAICLGGSGIFFLRQSLHHSMQAYEAAKLEGYDMEIKSEVQTALAEIDRCYKRFARGEISEDEAKELAKESIRAMRYRDDGSGYMWIDDTDYILVMHPILPEQEGNNRFDLTDQNGVKIIQDIMKSAKAGGGYNEFYFTKADGVTVAPKRAYSQLFEAWNWVVTTGNYVDDMEAEIQTTEDEIQQTFTAMIVLYVMIALVILAVGLVLAAVFGKRTAWSIHQAEENLKSLANGDLTFTVDKKLLARKDEIGSIGHHLQVVKAELTTMISSVVLAGREMHKSSERFSEKFENITGSIQNANKAIEELAQGATNQAGETETVNNKITELGRVIETERAEVDRLEASVDSMTNYSGKASESIRSLNEITGVTIAAIDVVSEQTNKNNDSAANINKAVEIIKGLAAQTNLLSLNASIEAARAGEAGRGFAVVAEEIRNLSEESASSAQEIESIVQELTGNVEISVSKMREVIQNVQKQQECLKETENAFGSLYQEVQSVEAVSKEIGEQAEALESLKQIVTDSVNNLASVVQENAASTEETSASMSLLSQTIGECMDDTHTLVELSQNQDTETAKFKIS